ncbi:MAG: hypothetical protein IJY90_02835 [Clostridia bacterium]|nr:hypothetical protein [Clostridia bacterium]
MNRFLETDEFNNLDEENKKNLREMYFGEGLSFSPFQVRDAYSTGGWVLKDDKLIGMCDLSPVASCEDSGYFLIITNREKGTYNICDAQGHVFKREFGKHSGPFYGGMARLEIIDEPIDKSQLNAKGNYALFTFAKVGKDGKLRLMRERFSHATFMDECGLARVMMPGEKTYAYVTKKGKVLPYRFKNAENFFRDGLAPVLTVDGVHAYIRENFDLVQIRRNGSIRVLITLEEYNKQMAEKGTVEFKSGENMPLEVLTGDISLTI